MDERGSKPRPVPATGAPASAVDGKSPEETEKDHFLQLMFFQGHHRHEAAQPAAPIELPRGEYAPLRHSMARAGERYRLPLPSGTAALRLDAPATEVMTDLRRVRAVTIELDASIDGANQAMIAHGVRALFVVGDARQVVGLVTSTDILGERPIQFAQERGIRHGEVVVRDIMTPAERLEIIDVRDVVRARVGDVVATLRLAGRQHALVVDSDGEAVPGQRSVCGIFSLTQIARQLGIPPQQVHDIARTFAEIEAAIAS